MEEDEIHDRGRKKILNQISFYQSRNYHENYPFSSDWELPKVGLFMAKREARLNLMKLYKDI